MSDVGYSVSDNPDRKGPLGHHGYDPEHPDMHGILIVSGPNIKQAELGLVNNLEVYGLLTKLLDIKAERKTGDTSLPQLLLK